MILYTGTKSKVKPKMKSKAERLAYEEWCNKHGIKSSGKNEKLDYSSKPLTIKKTYQRETAHYPSKSTGSGGTTSPVNSKKYTGTSMLGIAAMHKSNLVPVFQEEDAVDISHMRR